MATSHVRPVVSRQHVCSRPKVGVTTAQSSKSCATFWMTGARTAPEGLSGRMMAWPIVPADPRWTPAAEHVYVGRHSRSTS
jgi:hypothetical protein